MSSIYLSQINLYPVKSMKGHTLDTAQVQMRGLQYDRRWMVVNGEGRFTSQREVPRMALLNVELADDRLILSTPSMPALTLPMEPPANAPVVSVHVWGTHCDAFAVSEIADSWLSNFLGMPCRLVHMTDASIRPLNPGFNAGEGIVSFADAFPFMLLGQSSLEDLNSRLAEPLPMNRFRPTFEVTGSGPYAEDDWKRIRIGGAEFHVSMQCDRCALTTIDQFTGEKQGQEPLRTLATYRLFGQKVMFGMFLKPAHEGMVSVGDKVEVLESRTMA